MLIYCMRGEKGKNNECYPCAGGSAMTWFSAYKVQSRRSTAHAARCSTPTYLSLTSVACVAAQFINTGIYTLLMPVNNWQPFQLLKSLSCVRMCRHLWKVLCWFCFAFSVMFKLTTKFFLVHKFIQFYMLINFKIYYLKVGVELKNLLSIWKT